MKKRADISIIIVNTNDKKYLTDCLTSISKQRGTCAFEVWVVDNASTDGSTRFIKNVFPWVKIMRSDTNLLYTPANNRALKRVKSKYFLILNPDTILPPTTLSQMYRFMEMHPRAGLLGCRQIDEFGKTLRICHQFFTPLAQLLLLPTFYPLAKNSSVLEAHVYADWDRQSTRQVDTIPGSCMFGRTTLLTQIGLLDETLPMFYSDDDYCLRIKDAGYEVWYSGKTVITHLTSKSISQIPRLEVARQGYQDLVTYFRKQYGLFWAFIFYILTRIQIVFLIIYFAFSK